MNLMQEIFVVYFFYPFPDVVWMYLLLTFSVHV